MANNNTLTYFNDVYDPSATLEDYKEQLKNALFKIDPSFDLEESTELMNIISVWAIAQYQIMQQTIALYNDNNPYTASLPALINKYGALYGIEYKSGSKTQQEIQIVITEPCNIYAETTVEHVAFQITDNKGNIYVPTADNSFTSPGTYNVMFEAKEFGEIKSEINTINNIYTTTLGVQSVNNLITYTSLGSDVESVESYRKRILKASRFYKTQGTQQAIIDELINNGCDDAFIYKNYTGLTKEEVPSGCIAIFCKGGDSATIAKTLANEIHSAYMYGFPAVKTTATGVSYTRTQDISDNLEAFKGITNGVLSIQIGDKIQTSNLLDFSNCFSWDDVRKIITNNSGFTNISITYNSTYNWFKFENINTEQTPKEKIKLILTSGTTDTDLYGSDFFDGENQIVIEDGYIEIAHVIDVAEDRYVAKVCYNDAVVIQAHIRFSLQGIITTEQLEELKDYIISTANSESLFKINQSLTNMDFLSIIKTYINDNEIDAYAYNLKFKRDETEDWVENLSVEHIYEIYNISVSNISIG